MASEQTGREHPRRWSPLPWSAVVAAVAALVLPLGSSARLAAAETQVLSDDEWAAVQAAEASRIEVVRRITAPTIAIFAADGGGGGSGVLISPDGFALTNFHVVQPCGDHLKCGTADGVLHDAVVVGIDPTGDVALIQLLGRDDFPVAVWGDSDRIAVGENCFVVGNPFLLATDFRPTVTYGIISGVHRYQYPAGTLLEYADCLQTDAAINPGNSGGPLFNAQGELVGINGRASFEKRGRVNVGVGYAISIRQIDRFLGMLHSGRIVDHATLGATVSSDSDGRVLVSDILRSSDAYRRGLRFDDEIVALGDRKIRSANDFKNVLGTYPRGWRLPVTFLRDGVRQETLVRTAGVHSVEELLELVQGRPRPAVPGDRPPPGTPPGNPRPDELPPESPDPRRPEAAQRGAAPPLPQPVADRLEKRRGYANYYYNRQHRERLWQAFLPHCGALAGATGEWVLALQADELAELVLRDEEAFAMLPTRQVRMTFDQDLDSPATLTSTELGLLALACWRRLIVLGPEQYGEVYYLGTLPEPVIPPTRRLDVLVGVHGSTETHFYFDPQSGQLLRMEFFPSIDVDPLELSFLDLDSSGPAVHPRRIELRYGSAPPQEWSIESLRTQPAAAGAAS